MLNCHESWFLTLEFPRSATQFYRISKGKEIFVLPRISKGKVTNLRSYVILFNFLCVLVRAYWCFFNVFTAVGHKNRAMTQNKTEDKQSVTSSNWPRLTNPWKLFKPNKHTTELSFREFKILRWFTIIDYTLRNTLQDHTLH